jgi:hypothetical protein
MPDAHEHDRRRNGHRRFLGTLVCLLAIGSVPPKAQTPARLAGVKTVACTFTSVASGNWTGAATEIATHRVALNLSYEAVDADGGTAREIENTGTVDVIAKLSGPSLHLLWIGSEGAVHLTTVFDRETVPGRFRAVHTRHEYTDIAVPGFTSRPELYYGDCAISR